MQRALLPFAGIVLLATAVGFLAGNVSATIHTSNALPLPTVQKDLRPLTPVVEITDIFDGVIHGKIQGTVRVFGGERMASITENTFSIPLSSLTRVVAVSIPPGMNFVASKNGKSAYPVHSKSGERIVPANRVYFPTMQAAAEAGFSVKN